MPSNWVSAWIFSILCAGAVAADFVDVAAKAGLQRFINFQGTPRKDYLVESVGGGAAWIDFDQDGWLDAVLVRGKGPVCALFRNNGDGTFADVTAKAGIAAQGWGMGVSVADYDGDTRDDILVTGFGRNFLFRNRGNGTFEETAARAGVLSSGLWSTGAAFFDFDRDGDLDLYIARYGRYASGRTPRSPDCRFQGLQVFCGPQGMPSERHSLYRNDGGRFIEVRLPPLSGAHHGLGVISLDYDNDEWPDLYVANDSTPNLLWRNLGGGKFQEKATEAGVAYSSDGREQASMGVDAGDLFNRGWQDLFVTNFANEPFELYRNSPSHFFDDITWTSGVGKVTLPYMGWATHFLDLDLDGWLDIVAFNGHIYPEVGAAYYRQKALAFHNLKDGKFEAIPSFEQPLSARGAAVGDYDNDGDLDILVNNIDEPPALLNRHGRPQRNWLMVALPSNAVGARIKVTTRDGAQFREIRAQSGYLSSSDRRAHFGLGDATECTVEVRWLNQKKRRIDDVKANQVLLIREFP